MIVYDAEKQLGLEEKIRSSASISGNILIEPNNIQTIHKLGRIEASYGDEDLYFIKSILVTAGWNLNDDVFDKYELWKARATPVDKLLNLEHNPRQVVGHILDCYAIDDEGKKLDNTLAETQLPNKFHLVTPSVVYRFLSSKDKELEKEMSQIIAEIEEGKWSVSMECLFDDFDYAVTKEDKTVVIKRNSTTAHLSKHLRAYGGEGNYNEYKVGRMVKNLIFSGKGLTKKPANPESIIFTNTSSFAYSATANDLGYLTQTTLPKLENKVDNTEKVNAELENTRASLVASTKKNEELEQRIKDLNEKDVKAKLESAAAEVTKANEKVTALEAQVKTEQTARTDAESKVADLNKQLVEANEKLEKIALEKTHAERVSKWMEKTGVEKDVATATIEKFKSFNDEQFEAVLATQKAPEKVEQKKEEVLETAKAEKEATLASQGNAQGNKEAVASGLASFMKNYSKRK